MAIHAAMVDRMDREIGRVLDQLRAMGAYDDTLIVFLSDNGASAEIMVRDDGHDPAAPPGSAKSHLCLGPGWSTVSNTPFRRHKTWVHEGGISTPLIVHWPRGIAARGELRNNPGHVIDLVADGPGTRRRASVRNLGRRAGPHAARQEPRARLRPRRVGRARRPLVAARGEPRHPRGGLEARLRQEDGPWELYDLATDRTETRNLAKQNPEKFRELERRWEQRWEEISELAHSDLKSGQASKPARP